MKNFIYYAQAWSDDTQSVFAHDPTLLRSMFIGRFVRDLNETTGMRWSPEFDPITGQFFAQPTDKDMATAEEPANWEPALAGDDYEGEY